METKYKIGDKTDKGFNKIVKPLKQIIILYLNENNYLNLLKTTNKLKLNNIFDLKYFKVLIKTKNEEIFEKNIFSFYLKFKNILSETQIVHILAFLYKKTFKKDFKDNKIKIRTTKEIKFLDEISKLLDKEKIEYHFCFNVKDSIKGYEASLTNLLKNTKCVFSECTDNLIYLMNLSLKNKLKIFFLGSFQLNLLKNLKLIKTYSLMFPDVIEEITISNEIENLEILKNVLENNKEYLKRLVLDFESVFDAAKMFDLINQINFNNKNFLLILDTNSLASFVKNNYNNLFQHIKHFNYYYKPIFNLNIVTDVNLMLNSFNNLTNFSCTINDEEPLTELFNILVENNSNIITNLEIITLKSLNHNEFFERFILHNFKNLKSYKFGLDIISNSITIYHSKFKGIETDNIRIITNDLNEFTYFKRLNEILSNNILSEDFINKFNALIGNFNFFFNIINYCDYNNKNSLNRFNCLLLEDSTNEFNENISFEQFQIKKAKKIILKGNKIPMDIFNYLDSIYCESINIRFSIEEEHIKYFNGLFNLKFITIYSDPQHFFIKYFVSCYKSFINLNSLWFDTPVQLNLFSRLFYDDYIIENDIKLFISLILIDENECLSTMNINDKMFYNIDKKYC